ncbi:MAG: hypothetical protein U9O87_01570 [Verrucomicrobiota bacterium]|nr:hypothetical protein [Verrucomicrobiota bacterium]
MNNKRLKYSTYYQRSLVSVILTVLFTLSLFPQKVLADAFSWEINLAQKLIEIQMYDFAGRQLQNTLKKYPDKKDKIYVVMAELMAKNGKRKKGIELLNKISKNSLFYASSRLQLAKLHRSGAEAEKAYKEYFSVTKEMPENKYDAKNYKTAIMKYSAILKDAGKAKESTRILERLSAGLNSRQMLYVKAKNMMDAARQKKESGKAGYQSDVEAGMKLIKEIIWKGLDAVTASAFIEKANGECLLGKYDDALKTLKDAENILVQVDTYMKQQGDRNQSPLAGAILYNAVATAGKAQNSNSEKLFIEALKKFYMVTKKYPASPYVTDATFYFEKCKKTLEEKFDKRIEMSLKADPSQLLEAKMKQAADLFIKKELAKAAEYYLDAIRISRTCSKSPEAIFWLIMCYARQEQLLEMEAVLGFMYEVFPKHEKTAKACKMCSAVFFKKAYAIKGKTPEKERLMNAGIASAEKFISLSPNSPDSPKYAYQIAEIQYKKASKIAASSKKIEDQAKKEEIKAKARKEYSKAIPLYERLEEKYGANPRGIRAKYKLGWIYHSLDDKENATKAFLNYVQTENDRKYDLDKIEAKFRASEQLMMSGDTKEAVKHFKDILTWTSKDNPMEFDIKDKKIKDKLASIKENATSYIAWSYDLGAEQFREKLSETREKVRVLKSEGKDAEDIVEAGEEIIAKTEREIVVAKQKTEKINLPSPLMKEKAEKITEKKKDGEKQEVSEEEKKKLEELEKVNVKKMAKLKFEREQARISGEEIEFNTYKIQFGKEKRKISRRLKRNKTLLNSINKQIGKYTSQKESGENALGGIETKIKEKKIIAIQSIKEYKKAYIGWKKAVISMRKTKDKKKLILARSAQRKAVKEKQNAKIKARNAKNEYEETMSKSIKKKIKSYNARLKALRTVLKKLQRQKTLAERAKTLFEKELAYLNVELAVATKGLERNSIDKNYLSEKDEQKKEKLLKALEKTHEQYVQLLQNAKDKIIEKSMIEKNYAKEDKLKAEKIIEEAKKKIVDIQKSIKPTQEKFDALKKQALKFFAEFLKLYPKSKQAPANLARIGTIHIEFKNFEKAAGYLTTLKKVYPGDKTIKPAMFNLGRAYIEINDYKKATETFEDVLKTPKAYPTANISFIANKSLAAYIPGKEKLKKLPEIALKANKILLERIKNKKNPNYKELQNKKEATLFRIAQAHFFLANFDQAVIAYKDLFEFNGKTGFYFKAKMNSGIAKANKKDPDYNSAILDFGDIIKNAQDDVVANEASLEMGKALVKWGKEVKIKLGLSKLQQIIMLADKNLQKNKPILEEAYYESAKAFALIGEKQKTKNMQNEYRKFYPQGMFFEEIGKLPNAKFTPKSKIKPQTETNK